MTGAGYGQMTDRRPGRRGSRTVHRWVMEQVYGEDGIAGREVMHLCDNRRCFRFDHLALGTHRDNMRDAIAKGRFSFVQVPTGERHPHARLTQAKVSEARRRADAGESFASLAVEFGVSRSTIRKAVRGITWAS